MMQVEITAVTLFSLRLYQRAAAAVVGNSAASALAAPEAVPLTKKLVEQAPPIKAIRVETDLQLSQAHKQRVAVAVVLVKQAPTRRI
jgi:ABC-type transport system involved in Fe-S cluster assembly fused permease/ATPase subunit